MPCTLTNLLRGIFPFFFRLNSNVFGPRTGLLLLLFPDLCTHFSYLHHVGARMEGCFIAAVVVASPDSLIYLPPPCAIVRPLPPRLDPLHSEGRDCTGRRCRSQKGRRMTR